MRYAMFDNVKRSFGSGCMHFRRRISRFASNIARKINSLAKNRSKIKRFIHKFSKKDCKLQLNMI